MLLRVVARTVDLTVFYLASEALPKTGWMAGICYILIADGLWGGRSLGKKLVGLRTVGGGGAPCGVLESIARNGVIAVSLLLWRLPLVGVLFPPAVLALELLILIGSEDGRRAGDMMAGTSVTALDAVIGQSDAAGDVGEVIEEANEEANMDAGESGQEEGK